MYYFRIYIQARGTRNSERAEIARVKYMNQADMLYKLPRGRQYLASKLRAFLIEVEKALDNFASTVDEFEKAANSNNYNRQVLASDRYDNALLGFIEKYGRPEAWLDSSCSRKSGADWISQCKHEIMKYKKVEQWL